MRHCVAGRLRRGLGGAVMTGQLGVIYMLHFHRPYKHAMHYVGWTEDLLDRLDRHAKGTGARLIAVIWDAGIGSGTPGSASPWSASAKAPGTPNAPSSTTAAQPGIARPAPIGRGPATGPRSPVT
jgi:hypothetical protein